MPGKMHVASLGEKKVKTGSTVLPEDAQRPRGLTGAAGWAGKKAGATPAGKGKTPFYRMPVPGVLC